MKTALIMEGGAMRGLFTCGVLDVLMENNITFDGGAGISAGAVFGCNFKSGQAGRPLRYNTRFSRDPRYGSFRSVLKTGDLFDADFCYRVIPEELDVFDAKAFAENPMVFYIGATDAVTGKIVFHKCSDGGKNDTMWMRASASMPLVSRVVDVDGYHLLDGGIACSVPFEFMEQEGYDHNVIILTQPMGFVKKKSKIVPLLKAALKEYPAVAETMAVRHNNYNRELEQIRERELAGTALVIRPPEALHIGRTEKDPDELRRVYRFGRMVAESRLAEIKEFLSVKEGVHEPQG